MSHKPEMISAPALLLRHDGLTTLRLLLAMAALGWGLTIYLSQAMACGMCSGMSVTCPMCMGATEPLWRRAISFLGMWITMNAAMMLPSLSLIVLLVAQSVERPDAMKIKIQVTWLFISGYLFSWMLAGVVAFALVQVVQWAMRLEPLLQNYKLASAIMIGAGIYQWTPLKLKLLRHCRSAEHLHLKAYSEDRWYWLRAGARHGIHCIGSCLGLMLLMFATGLMNLRWMAALTVLIALEKMSRREMLVCRITGGLLIITGAAWILRATSFF